MTAPLLLVLVLCVGMSTASSVSTQLENAPLVLLDNTEAKCIDGSPAGFYFKPSHGQSDKNKWVVYMQGGGICTDPATCYQRAQTDLGSSKNWKSHLNFSQFSDGPLSPDCSVNPTFCNFNVALIKYCDGFLYNSNLKTTVSYSGLDMYFRGTEIRNTVLQTLASSYGFGRASDVLITGCSAGGLSTFLHSDVMSSWIMTNTAATNVRALPSSGFFLTQPNVNYHLTLLRIVRYMLELTNGTSSLNADCVAANPTRPWYCAFAEVTFSHSKVPTFVLNSKTDAWQIPCELFNEPILNGTAFTCNSAEPYASCTKIGAHPGFEGCSLEQIRPVIWYQWAFMNRVEGIATFRKEGNGAFISSCLTHCEAEIGQYWSQFDIHGNKMNEAVGKWWNGDVSVPAMNNTYVDCERDEMMGSTGYECNPVCATAAKSSRGYRTEVEESTVPSDLSKWFL